MLGCALIFVFRRPSPQHASLANILQNFEPGSSCTKYGQQAYSTVASRHTCSSLQPSARATTPLSLILVHLSTRRVCSCGQAAANPLKPSSPTPAQRPTLRCLSGVFNAISASRALLTSGMPVSMTDSSAGRPPVRAACNELRLTPRHSVRSSSLQSQTMKLAQC